MQIKNIGNEVKKCLHWKNVYVTITRLARAKSEIETIRRCGKCPENVKYAARVRLLAMQFLTLISIQEENGMLISRP